MSHTGVYSLSANLCLSICVSVYSLLFIYFFIHLHIYLPLPPCVCMCLLLSFDSHLSLSPFYSIIPSSLPTPIYQLLLTRDAPSSPPPLSGHLAVSSAHLFVVSIATANKHSVTFTFVTRQCLLGVREGSDNFSFGVLTCLESRCSSPRLPYYWFYRTFAWFYGLGFLSRTLTGVQSTREKIRITICVINHQRTDRIFKCERESSINQS